MSYWSHHPEELEELTIRNLPEPWKTQVEEEEIYLTDVPQDLVFEAQRIGVEDYWAERTANAVDMMKGMRI